jgi:hypothetical protein
MHVARRDDGGRGGFNGVCTQCCACHVWDLDMDPSYYDPAAWRHLPLCTAPWNTCLRSSQRA